MIDNSEEITITRTELEAVAAGERTVESVVEDNSDDGSGSNRREILQALGLLGLGASGVGAIVAGSDSAEASESNAVGPVDTAFVERISGNIVADGEEITRLLNVEVVESEDDIPDEIPENTVILHG